MRLLATGLLTILACAPLAARPLSFERRSPDLYAAWLGNQPLTIRPNSVAIGEVTLRFANASPSSRLAGLGASSPSTYLSGSNRRTFTQFPKVALRQLYPGIDAIFYGNGQHLEYDLVVSPGADLHPLRMRFDGARNLQVDTQGNLKVESRSGYLLQMLPRVFQSDGRPVAASYVHLPNGEVEFRIGTHNPRLALTIDPQLVFTRYFGGSASDSANAIATDAQGNIYIAGTSNSLDFPTTSGVPPKSRAPMAAISGGGATFASLPVDLETSILGIGGTPDGSVIYAVGTSAVYVTSDHGASWTALSPLPIQLSPAGFLISPVNSVNVDPIDPSRVFVATNRGLFFSGQGAQAWALFDYALPTNGSGQVSASSVLISPIDHTVMYVVIAQPPGIYKTTNAGASWTPLNPTYPGQPPVPAFQSYAATLGQNGSDLYVVDPFGVLLLSKDAGVTWQQLGQGLFGAASIVIDPANPLNIYVSGYGGIQKSSNGGATFSSLLPPSSIVGMVNQVALDPASETLYFGSSNASVAAIPTSGGPARPLPVSTPNLHSLITLGSQVYAGFDTPSSPYVVKWDPTGTNILYSTFLGGTLQDSISRLVIDAQGNCTIAGNTGSANFPVTAKLPGTSAVPYLPGGFVARLSADGTQLLYSVLLGGSKGLTGPYAPTSIQGLALDSSGAAYITGQTAAADFPVSSNAFQSARPTSTCPRPPLPFVLSVDSGINAFVSKLSPDGSQLVYSTLITGSCGSFAQSLAVNSAGEAIVAGSTTSTDLPTTAGTYQSAFPGTANLTAPPNPIQAGFVARISAAGDSMIAGTFLGGSYMTQATAVALDSAGNAYLTGSTAKMVPGATPGAYQATAVDRCVIPLAIGPSPPYGGTNDAFVLKLDPTLTTAGYLTYLGGGCNDAGNDLALDPSGNIWITGLTSSPDFPLKSPFQARGVNGRFVSQLNANGSQLLFSSSTDGVALAIDPTGLVYMAGTGTTSGIAKSSQASGRFSPSAEWIRINPASAPAVVIDNVQSVTSYPQVPLIPSNLGNGVAPGELVQITGRNLGPATQAKGQLDATGRLPFTLAGTTVLFDNIPAPLVSSSDTSVICFAPFEVSQSASITVASNGQQSNSVRIGIAPTDPQILSITNQDGTLNSTDHPAKPGDEIAFYMSGLGQTKPLSADGLTNTVPLMVPVQPVTAYIAGKPVQPAFIGAAPGQVAGIVQVNLHIPGPDAQSNQVYVILDNVAAPVYVSP